MSQSPARGVACLFYVAMNRRWGAQYTGELFHEAGDFSLPVLKLLFLHGEPNLDKLAGFCRKIRFRDAQAGVGDVLVWRLAELASGPQELETRLRKRRDSLAEVFDVLVSSLFLGFRCFDGVLGEGFANMAAFG
jgi:hypothetical protein